MASGFRCTHCGKQETTHTLLDDIAHEKGYRFNVTKCPGFTLNQRDKKQTEIRMNLDSKMANWEREANFRSACGLYSAYVRQQNLNEKLDRAGSESERRKILQKAQEQNSRGFYIG